MSDISTWLRGLSEKRRQAFGDDGLIGCRYNEAADEIERLRAIIEEIDSALQVLAAKYVPPISDVVAVIDRIASARKRVNCAGAANEAVPVSEGDA